MIRISGSFFEQTPLRELNKRLICSSKNVLFFKAWSLFLMLFSHNHTVNSMLIFDKISSSLSSQS